MMIAAVVILGIVVAVLGFNYIEKKRKLGTLTYPLWRGNLLIPWAGFAVVFTLLMGSFDLPRMMALAEHGVPGSAVIIKQYGQGQYCRITYRYAVQGKDYTGTDSNCGAKSGDKHKVYYDPESPESSTLSPPKAALKNELIAMGLIDICLPTVIVLWLMLTQVIGMRKKP